MDNKSFTLAEIMIALTIIGVITAILLPVAQNSLPNEKVMKFKKANATLARVINELVTSGEYYIPGDLGMKPDGTVIDGSHEGDYTYFCKTFADTITTKNNNCKKMLDVYPEAKGSFIILSEQGIGSWDEETGITTYTKEDIFVDNTCKNWNDAAINKEIVSLDGITYYQTWPNSTFGLRHTVGCGWDAEENRCLDIGERIFINYKVNNIYTVYSVICFDIDSSNGGEDPFGYGIRVDGKMILGARAQEWLEKDIQDKE